MNKTELAYAQHLESLKLSGKVAWYKFDSVNLRLADGTYYKPDFMVMMADGALEVHEVKGYWTDDAKVKIKVAANIFPFKFIAVTKNTKRQSGGWKAQEF